MKELFNIFNLTLQFYGVYHFKYPISELLHYFPTLEGMEIVITATVGDRFLNEIIDGYSVARFFNSSLKVSFLGDSPQVFKPGMPIMCYVSFNIETPFCRGGVASADWYLRLLIFSVDCSWVS